MLDVTDSGGNTRHLAVEQARIATFMWWTAIHGQVQRGTVRSTRNCQAHCRGAGFPAFFNNTVYYGSVDATLKAFPRRPNSPRRPSIMPRPFGYPGRRPAFPPTAPPTASSGPSKTAAPSSTPTTPPISQGTLRFQSSGQQPRPFRRQQVHHPHGRQRQGLCGHGVKRRCLRPAAVVSASKFDPRPDSNTPMRCDIGKRR